MSETQVKDKVFRFKRFEVSNCRGAMRVGTDGVTLGAWVDMPTGECGGRVKVLDVGSGTGLIALMIAQRYPTAEVTGVEIDPDAAAEGADNAAASPFADRVTIIRGDFNAFHPGERYHLIVSNPPFFTETLQSPDAARAAARHEGSLSLTSLLVGAKRLLTPQGQLALIAPSQRDAEVEFEAHLRGYGVKRKCYMVSVEGKAPKRTLWQLSAAPCGPASETVLTLRCRDSRLTAQYASMVRDFYLDVD